MKGLINYLARINQIINLVSHETGISVDKILSRSRKAPVVHARQISMWLCRWNSKSSLQVIAYLHGCTNHANVIHGCNQIENLRSVDPAFKAFTNKLKDIING